MKLPKNFKDIDGMGGTERSSMGSPWRPHPTWPQRSSMGIPGPYRPADMKTSSARPSDPVFPNSYKVIKQGPTGVEGGTMIQSPNKPSNFVVTSVQRGEGIPPTWVGYFAPPTSDDIPMDTNYMGVDGGAVKKNWVPLVVLGVSLAVGIGISEWASKKYIK